MKMRCREKIKYLYKRSWKNLTLCEKDLFKLPLQFRLKGTVEGMRLWIEMAEMIFQQKDKNEKNQHDIKNCFFPQTKQWLRRSPNTVNR